MKTKYQIQEKGGTYRFRVWSIRPTAWYEISRHKTREAAERVLANLHDLQARGLL